MFATLKSKNFQGHRPLPPQGGFTAPPTTRSCFGDSLKNCLFEAIFFANQFFRFNWNAAIAGTPLETREFYHPFVTGRTKEVLFLENTKLYKHINLNITRELASYNKSYFAISLHIETCRLLISL